MACVPGTTFVDLLPRPTRRSIIHYAIMLTSVGSGYETRGGGGGGGGFEGCNPLFRIRYLPFFAKQPSPPTFLIVPDMGGDRCQNSRPVFNDWGGGGGVL